MTRSRLMHWILCCLAVAAVGVAGCSTDTTTSGESTGSLDLNLELAPGVVINEVKWVISRPLMEDMMGTIDTSAPGATASVEVFGLPPGEGYTVTLTAMAEGEDTTCGGSANFSVEVGVSTPVMVMLNCKRPETLGGVRVNGKLNICAELAKVIVSPLQTSVGNDIDLSALAQDVDDDQEAIRYLWTGTGGSIADPTDRITTYTCEEVGDHTIVIRVSDDPEEFGEFCMDDWDVDVTCVEGDGGLCEGNTCDDNDTECSNSSCSPLNGECFDTPVNEGGDCDGGEGTCMAGDCIISNLCDGNTCDDNDTECSNSACNPLNGECFDTPINEGGTCDDIGVCMSGDCINLCDGNTCDDNDTECSDSSCNPPSGQCVDTPINEGGSCQAGEGTCNAGVCEPNAPVCEYEQDFEGLDPGSDPPNTALADDGWLVFANVFAPDGTTFLYNYGVFGAPNGGPGFSAVDSGQGGPDQGAQQLSIYSDYNNADHGVGNVIETLVFQERSIVADDVGKTFTFTFDAKAGNIEGSSEALAFIKTLDPGAGFATTNFFFEDTTNLPGTWGTFSIEITIDGGLVGQLLQYGFQTRAANFEGSGVFYDNVSFCTPGDGGGTCVPPALPNLTVNGDFETGDTCGWEFFPNDGTFAATMAQSNGGAWSGNLVASVPGGGGPPSFPVIKQANIGIGIVQPNSSVDISFDLYGSVSGAGGVFFAEFFSELSGGGVSKSEILGGGPLFPNSTWTTYSFTTTTGNDVSGGVTLQLKADCGANAGCTVDAYIDNVSVTIP